MKFSKRRAAKRERNRIKRRDKKRHQARVEYWERRSSFKQFKAEALDPDKHKSAMEKIRRLAKAIKHAVQTGKQKRMSFRKRAH